jgi:hypothetical protein
LHLDADECVPTELKNELQSIAKENPQLVYRVASRIFFQGTWIKRSSMYPCYQVRFGRSDHLRFRLVGHGQRETVPASEIATLKHDLDHFSFSKGIADWIEKHNRYSSDEARQTLEDRGSKLIWRQLISSDPTTRRREFKRLANRFPFRPTLRFLYVYFGCLGFLDGSAGFQYAQLMAMYERVKLPAPTRTNRKRKSVENTTENYDHYSRA